MYSNSAGRGLISLVRYSWGHLLRVHASTIFEYRCVFMYKKIHCKCPQSAPKKHLYSYLSLSFVWLLSSPVELFFHYKQHKWPPLFLPQHLHCTFLQRSGTLPNKMRSWLSGTSFDWMQLLFSQQKFHLVPSIEKYWVGRKLQGYRATQSKFCLLYLHSVWPVLFTPPC